MKKGFISAFVLISAVVCLAQPQARNVALISRLYNHWNNVTDIEMIENNAYLTTNSSGLQIVDLADPNNPAIISYYDLDPGRAQAVAIVGNLAYIADETGGLRILNIEDPENIIEIGAFETPDRALDVLVNDNIAYLAVNEDGVLILDVENPEAPQFLSRINIQGTASDLYLTGDLLFVCAGFGGLIVADVSAPQQPNILSVFIQDFNRAGDVVVDGGLAYIAFDEAGLVILDVTEPDRLQWVSSYQTDRATALDKQGNIVYLASGNHRSGFLTIDVSNLDALTVLGSSYARTIYDVCVRGNFAYLGGFDNGFKVYDVEDPRQINLIAELGSPGYLFDIARRDDLLFIAGKESGLHIVSIEDIMNPVETGVYQPQHCDYEAVAASAEYVAAANNTDIETFDVSAPDQPQVLGARQVNGWLSGMETHDVMCFVASGPAGLNILSLANPQRPYAWGNHNTGFIVHDVAYDGEFVYLSEKTVLDPGSVRVINIDQPDRPVEIGSCVIDGQGCGIATDGNFAYIAHGEEGLKIIDVRVEDNPRLISAMELPGTAFGVEHYGRHVFVCAMYAGVRVINVSNPRAPFETGFFVTPGEAVQIDLRGIHGFVAGYSNVCVLDFSDAVGIPAWTEIPEDTVFCAAGEPTEFQVAAEDPDENDLTIIFRPNGLPESATLEDNGDGAGVFRFEPIHADTGIYNPLFIVTDRIWGDTTSVILQVDEPIKLVDIENKPPSSYEIVDIYPNPFNSSTTITYTLPTQSPATFQIYNTRGQLVDVLADRVTPAGRHQRVWKADGQPSGVYLVKLLAADLQFSQKIILMR